MLNHILFNMISETIKDRLKDVDNYSDRMKIIKKCSEELAKNTHEIESEYWTYFYKTRFFKRLNDGFPVADLHTNTTSYLMDSTISSTNRVKSVEMSLLN